LGQKRQAKPHLRKPLRLIVLPNFKQNNIAKREKIKRRGEKLVLMRWA
jgi:hypothetical protein